ncbi:MAG: hypothetical protein V4850_16195 [Myxococcota bacterium]
MTEELLWHRYFYEAICTINDHDWDIASAPLDQVCLVARTAVEYALALRNGASPEGAEEETRDYWAECMGWDEDTSEEERERHGGDDVERALDIGRAIGWLNDSATVGSKRIPGAMPPA